MSIDSLNMSSCLNVSNVTQDPEFKRALDQYHMFAFFIDSIMSGLFCIWGFVGNGLVILTLWRQRLESTTSFLLVVLACVDTIYLVHSFLFQSLRSVYPYTGVFKVYLDAWPYIEPYEFPFGLMAQHMMIWVVVLVGIDRWIGVCKPLHAKTWCTITRIKIQLIVLFVISVLFAIPRFFVQRTVETKLPCTNVTIVSIEQYGLGKNVYYTYTYNVLFLLLEYLIPLTLLIVVNIHLVRAIRASYKMTAELRPGCRERNDTQRDKITRMLIIVIAVFIVCQTPIFINHLIYIKGYLGLPHSYFNVLSNMLATLNSSINFFIYFLLGKKFRRMLRGKLCGKSRAEEEIFVLQDSSSSDKATKKYYNTT